jgi:plasmid stabilization system protein ParE
MTELRFLEEAEAELDEAVRFYNDERTGLGFELASQVERSISNIMRMPESWSLISRRARKCTVWRFPFVIIYYVAEDSIVIIAIMHAKRRPNYWKERIG